MQRFLDGGARGTMAMARQTLGIRMKLARQALGLSQQDIADECNISRSAVSQWEADETIPGYDNLEKAAGKLEVEVEWLRTGKGRAPDLRGVQLVGRAGARPRDKEIRPPGEDFIPEQLMGIGAGPMVLEGRIYDWWRLPIGLVHETLRSDPNVLVFLRSLSDAMHPTIKRGDVVLIDQSQTTPIDGQIFAIDNSLGAILRRVIIKVHGEVTLRSDHDPDQDISVKPADVRFIGRCVGAFVIL